MPEGARSPLAVIVAATALGENGEKTYVFGSDYWGKDAVALAKAVDGLDKPWIVELPDAAGPILDALVKSASDAPRTVFWSPLAPRSLFVTTERVVESEDARVLAHGDDVGEVPEPLTDFDQRISKALTHVKLHKTDEERFVLGVVLEPDVIDSQNDFETIEDIRKAAHTFMEHFSQLGKQHEEIVTGKLKVLESYLAPADFDIGEEKVKKGTWLMAIRVTDDDLWESVKKGTFTGFSIGGFGCRAPADLPAT
jgi:hypothetical protein